MSLSYMQSYVLEYRKSITTVSTANGRVDLQIPLNLKPNRKYFIRLIKCILSSEIPNIYNYNNVNNGLISITRDGVTWVDIQLPNGIYTVSYINSAINAVARQLLWFTDPDVSGLLLNYNPATKRCYVNIDSTKLTPVVLPLVNQLGINFSNSLIWDVLGFLNNDVFIVDGLHDALGNAAKLDYQSTYVDIRLDMATGLKNVNGVRTNILCTVPLVTDSGDNVEYIYPRAGCPSPLIGVNLPSTLSSFGFNFSGGRNNEIIWTDGNVIVEFEILEG